jgi:Na+/H+-dicarboxylate symporter
MEVQVLVSLALAVLVGLFTPDLGMSSKWMGVMFLNLLKMVVPFLLFFSILTAVLGVGDAKTMGSLGSRTIGLYMFTTVLAIMTILFVMNVFQPGIGFNIGTYAESTQKIQELSVTGFLSNMIPTNIIEAFAEGKAMQLVVLAFIAGFAALRIAPRKREELFNGADNINNVILSFTKLIIVLTPFGVFGLVADLIARQGINTILDLWFFVATILGALFFHALVVLPAVAWFFGKFNPYKFMAQIKKPLLIGFGCASSSATLPVSMAAAVEQGGVSKKVVDLVLPIGSTINMDGTALYQAGIAIFIAQALGIDLTMSQQLTIVFAVVLASVGASGIPGAGIVMLTVVFESVGLPIGAVAVIMAVDRFLDMFRTSINIWGDLCVAKIIDRYYKISSTPA